jgi:hypothetical protein
MSRAGRTIRMTDAEYRAVASALSWMEMESGYDDDPTKVDAQVRRDCRAVHRVLTKYREASK